MLILSCGLFSRYFLRTVWGLQRLVLGLTKRFHRRGASLDEDSFLDGCIWLGERQGEAAAGSQPRRPSEKGGPGGMWPHTYLCMNLTSRYR